MKFEDRINEILNDKSEKGSIEQIYAETLAKFFPFTRQCPRDGKECTTWKCKQYRREEDLEFCLEFELKRMICESADNVRDTIRFEIENETLWWIAIDWYVNDNFGISLYSHNQQVLRAALKKIGYNIFFTGVIDSVRVFPGIFASIEPAKQFIYFLIEHAALISGCLVQLYTCKRCRKFEISYDREIIFTKNGWIGICDDCVNTILTRWVNGEIEKSEGQDKK